MLEQDQQEIRTHSHAQNQAPNRPDTIAKGKALMQHCMERAQKALDILDAIGLPTIDKVGAEGLEAIAVIALHAKYSVMKKALTAFEDAQKKEPANAYKEAIPALTDKIRILEHKKQYFGTQWLVDDAGKFFFYPVEDFAHMNARRKQYGLRSARHPRDLTYGIPEGPLPPLTKESDQREPTAKEYKHHTSGLLD